MAYLIGRSGNCFGYRGLGNHTVKTTPLASPYPPAKPNSSHQKQIVGCTLAGFYSLSLSHATLEPPRGSEWRWRVVNSTHEVTYMLWTIFVVLLVMWLLGLVSSYTLGGYIHILLVIAVVVLLINLITGRRPVL